LIKDVLEGEHSLKMYDDDEEDYDEFGL